MPVTHLDSELVQEIVQVIHTFTIEVIMLNSRLGTLKGFANDPANDGAMNQN